MLFFVFSQDGLSFKGLSVKSRAIPTSLIFLELFHNFMSNSKTNKQRES